MTQTGYNNNATLVQQGTPTTRTSIRTASTTPFRSTSTKRRRRNGKAGRIHVRLFFIRQGTIMVGIHDLSAYFDIAASTGGVNIVPHVRAAAPVDVSYSLRITRTGGAGSASLTRSGESRLAGGEDQPLATLLLSVDSSDICKATLVLHVNGEHAEYSADCNPHRTAG
ncbi:curli-like amyloid fiber formation chaperone CsgH [Burkholderia cepacia]|uniref:curli-like amyloid fiber formation chaperone CsgH n=2 Tax=Burkholderia cepacia TaxID=292 RepID=UPI0011B40812|nr:curli-like amyloid fiber formation chaperone CsgH [Burkholderia cepacia]MDN7886996.1 curli-like amyloid fiber formation chaperone CsgH [Burkholderia cepacia]